MLDYILWIRNIYDNLIDVREPLSKKDQIIAIPGGLGPKYNPYIVTITS